MLLKGAVKFLSSHTKHIGSLFAIQSTSAITHNGLQDPVIGCL